MLFASMIAALLRRITSYRSFRRSKRELSTLTDRDLVDLGLKPKEPLRPGVFRG
jgi:uncharacterized protein YjiS (DUF1127 family)